MCFSSGGGGGATQAATQQEQTRQANITQGQGAIDSAFSGFTPDFYDKQAKAYTDFAQPQLDKQWSDAGQQLHFALDRAGIQNSSAAEKANSDAQYEHDLAEQNISNTAKQTAAATQEKVGQSRQSLEGQLNADANAGEAASNASSQSSLLGLSPAFSPVGNLFQNLTGNLSAYAQGYPLLGTPGYTGALGAGAYGSGVQLTP